MAERAGASRYERVRARSIRDSSVRSPPPRPLPRPPLRASPSSAPRRAALSPLRSAPPFLRTRSDIHVRGRVFYLFDPLGAAEQWREAILAAKAELLMGGSAGPA